MSENNKLSYFNIRGLAGPIRLLLVDNGIAFDDHQFTMEQWPEIKPTMPFGQAPCFFHDGVPLAQSGAILRHLARKYNLYGSDLNQSAFIDMFYEGVCDLRKKYQDYIYRDAESKESLVTSAKSELEKLEKLGSKHASFPGLKAGSYVAGDKVSYADYVFFELLDAFVTLEPTILDQNSTLKNYYTAFSKRPKLAAYLGSEKHKQLKFNGNGKQ